MGRVVQAVFSILAICAGFVTMYLQNRHADKAREAERIRGAEVVAYRLSGWLADIDTRVKLALKECREGQTNASQGPPRILSDVITKLRLNMPSRIEDSVLADLHYLSSGSGDVAQLDHYARGYEAWLDGTLSRNTKLGGDQTRIAGVGLRDIYTRAEKLLVLMIALHENAARHIRPIQDQATERDGAIIVDDFGGGEKRR
jgi:hypothetical protein